MLGIVLGDIVGSIYEFDNYKKGDNIDLISKAHSYTDDTIIALASAKTILEKKCPETVDFARNLWTMGRKFPTSYGAKFSQWLASNPPKPYESYGNGALVRILATVLALKRCGIKDQEKLISLSVKNLECSHNHSYCYNAAQCLCSDICDFWKNINFNVKPHLIRSVKNFGLCGDSHDETLMSTLPICCKIFSESKNFKDLMIRSIKYCGDTDTICAICGGLWEAFYGDEDIYSFISENKVNLKDFLDKELIEILQKFYKELNY